MSGLIVLIALFVVSIAFLRWFDVISGRGPKQISDGIAKHDCDLERISCPMCAEKILPQAQICPFCKSKLSLD